MTRRGDNTGGLVAATVAGEAAPPEEPPPGDPEEPPGIVIDTETVDPVPIRLVAPTVTVTREPAVRPVRAQKASVAFTKVQERFTEYAVIAEPPSSTGAVHDATAVVFESAVAVSPVGATGAVAGTPKAVAVFDESSEPLAVEIVTIFTSYAVPLVRPVNVYVSVFTSVIETGVPQLLPRTLKYTS